MPNKITWKSGMRLTSELFDSMDAARSAVTREVSEMASAGRYGLFSVSRPFSISANVGGDILEVVSLRCHGITKSGQLVDIDFDSNYSNTFDTRVPLPQAAGDEPLLLVVRMHPGQWRKVDETYSEAEYTFELVGVNSRIDDDCLPVARLVNQYGWRLDESDYVPPCLYVSAHRRHEEQLARAAEMARALFVKCMSAHDCVAKGLLASVWGMANIACPRLDRERETLTPAQLFSIIQQYVGAFLIGCALDDYVSLENPDPYVRYTQRPLDARTLYRDIEEGLALCAEIGVKMDAVCTMTEVKEMPPERPAPRPAPRPQPRPDTEPKVSGRNRWDGIEI